MPPGFVAWTLLKLQCFTVHDIQARKPAVGASCRNKSLILFKNFRAIAGLFRKRNAYMT